MPKKIFEIGGKLYVHDDNQNLKVGDVVYCVDNMLVNGVPYGAKGVVERVDEIFTTINFLNCIYLASFIDVVKVKRYWTCNLFDIFYMILNPKKVIVTIWSESLTDLEDLWKFHYLPLGWDTLDEVDVRWRWSTLQYEYQLKLIKDKKI